MVLIDLDKYIDNNTVFLTDKNTIKKVVKSILNDYNSELISDNKIKFKTNKLFHISSIFFESVLSERILYSIDLDNIKNNISIETSSTDIKKSLSTVINKLYKKAKNIEKSLIIIGDDNNGRAS